MNHHTKPPGPALSATILLAALCAFGGTGARAQDLFVTQGATGSGSSYLDLRRIVPVTGNAPAGEGKSQLCAACHGPQGIAIAPNFPNLAGQRADYIYWELVTYKRGARPQSAMTPLTETLSDEDLRDLAVYYATLAPSGSAADADGTGKATPADPLLLQHGESLFLHGNPEKGIPPCQGCHGADARGNPHAARIDGSGYAPYAVYPALRGQPAEYLQAKLGELQDGKLHDSTADLVMAEIGRRLDDESIEALSVWLSSLAL